MRRSYLVYFLTVLIYGGLATEAKTQQIVEELKKWFGVGYKDHVVIGEWEHVGYSSKNLHFFPDATVSINNQKCKWTIVDNQTVRIECESALGAYLQVFSVKKSNDVFVGSFTNESNKIYKRPNDNNKDFLLNKVSIIRFFESDGEALDFQKRKYRTRFPKESSRYINWELNFNHPRPWRRIDFKIKAIWYNPGGNIINSFEQDTYILPEWTGSNHNNGWGWKDSGNWSLGTYRVEFYVEGILVGDRSFEIY